MNSKALSVVVLFTTIFFSSSSAALADDASMLARLTSLEKTMSQMQGVIDRQNVKIATLEGVPRDEGYIAKEPVEVPWWLEDLKFNADVRLRYEALSEHGASNLPDRNRFRYRMRFGFEKGFEGPFHEDDKMKVGFRLVSATNNNITSTNTTLDSQFRYKDVSIDKAYASYYPALAKFGDEDGFGLIKTEITAGKFANPFTAGSTWMLWDSDVTPEGIYEKFDFSLLKTEDLDLGASLTFGQLIAEEGSGIFNDHDDAEIYAYQAILNSKIKAFTEKPIKMKNAFSWYKYEDFSLPGNFLAAGNNTRKVGDPTTLERSFNVINIYNELAFPLSFHKAKGFKVYADWFRNVDGKGLDIANAADDYAWMLGAKLGKAKKKGTWEAKYEYAWIGSNASPDVFNDGDFLGTDRRGSIIKAKYALTDSLKFGTSLWVTDRITGDDNERDLWQFDLAWKF